MELNEVLNLIVSKITMPESHSFVTVEHLQTDSKEELKILLEGIRKQLSRLKLELNERKTHITKLSHGFTFMQIKYSIDGQRVIKRPSHSKVVRERRRLKKYKLLFDKGVISEFDIHNAYKSWRNGVMRFWINGFVRS